MNSSVLRVFEKSWHFQQISYDGVVYANTSRYTKMILSSQSFPGIPKWFSLRNLLQVYQNDSLLAIFSNWFKNDMAHIQDT